MGGVKVQTSTMGPTALCSASSPLLVNSSSPGAMIGMKLWDLPLMPLLLEPGSVIIEDDGVWFGLFLLPPTVQSLLSQPHGLFFCSASFAHLTAIYALQVSRSILPYQLFSQLSLLT